jgi:hypothetical protein
MPIWPDAASFFEAHVQNLADYYTCLPDAIVLVKDFLRRCFMSAAIGKKIDDVDRN